MSANEITKEPDVTGFLKFPIWTGPTLEPSRLGPDGFIVVLEQLLACLPNRELFVERRRREVNAVAPVRFRV